MNLTDELREELEAAGGALGQPDEQNEVYAETAKARDDLAFFVSLECWHDTPYGDGWEEACKEDARRWVAAGASGFKDHVGKQWQSGSDGAALEDTGIFAGGWSRKAGRCADIDSGTPNRDCVKSEDVVYPLLTDEWRAVVKYIVEDLRAPIITHATTWYGAEAECWDPMTSSLQQCAPMSREHLLDFLSWAEGAIDVNARRRIVVGHGGFMVPGERLLPRDSDTVQQATERERIAQEMLGQLDEVLATGVSVEAATTGDFVAMTYRQEGELGACMLRKLFAEYPDQLMLGTDRILDNGECLAHTYQLWGELLGNGVREQGPQRGACFGAAATYGLALDQPTIPECPGETALPTDIVERFLKKNFLALYD